MDKGNEFMQLVLDQQRGLDIILAEYIPVTPGTGTDEAIDHMLSRIMERDQARRIPSMELTGLLLDSREQYTDLVKYTNKILRTTPDRQYWSEVLEQQQSALYLIESQLLEIESSAS